MMNSSFAPNSLATVAFAVLLPAVRVSAEETASPMLMLRGNTAAIRALSFGPDGKSLTSVDSSGVVKVWDPWTGKEVSSVKMQSAIEGVLSFSPSGNLMASGSGDINKPGEIKVWDLTNGKQVLSLKGHQSQVLTLAFSPDGKHLASASGLYNPKKSSYEKGEIRTWLLTDGKEELVLRGHSTSIMGLSYSPDGKQLASAAGNNLGGEIILWDLARAKAFLTIKADTWTRNLAFAPGGKRLVSTCQKNGDFPQIMIWDLISDKAILAFSFERHYQQPRTVAFSPDGRYLVNDWGPIWPMISLWDLELRREQITFKAHDNNVSCVALSPDAKLLASAGFVDKTIKIWDVSKLLKETKELVYQGKNLSAWIQDLKSNNWSVRKDAVQAALGIGPEKALFEPLTKAIQDEDRDTRLLATSALAQFGPEAVPPLTKALQDKDVFVRRTAAFSLGEMGPDAKSGVLALLEAIKDEESDVRINALHALGEIGSEAKDAVKQLGASLKDKDAGTRLAVISTLANIGQPALVELQDALKDENADVRATALAGLGRIGTQAKTAAPLLRTAQKDGDLSVRIEAYHALACVSPSEAKNSVAFLVDALKDPKNFQYQRMIISALGEIGPEAKTAVPLLVNMLKDEFHKFQVVEALAGIGPGAEPAVPLLIEDLKSELQPVRFRAAVALGRIGPGAKSAEKALKAALADENAGVRNLCWLALAKINPDNIKTSIDQLTNSLNDEDPRIRISAALNLGELGTAAKNSEPKILALLKDRDRHVRQAAAAALEQIKAQGKQKDAAP
jgi:HEAT repeat protein/WD40 repeat protein